MTSPDTVRVVMVPPAKLSVIKAEIRADVEAGKLTPEEAERKLDEVRKEMFGGLGGR